MARSREAIDVYLRMLKKSNNLLQKIQQLHCQEQRIDHIPSYLPGLSYVHISSDNHSQNSCIHLSNFLCSSPPANQKGQAIIHKVDPQWSHQPIYKRPGQLRFSGNCRTALLTSKESKNYPYMMSNLNKSALMVLTRPNLLFFQNVTQ